MLLSVHEITATRCRINTNRLRSQYNRTCCASFQRSLTHYSIVIRDAQCATTMTSIDLQPDVVARRERVTACKVRCATTQLLRKHYILKPRRVARTSRTFAQVCRAVSTSTEQRVVRDTRLTSRRRSCTLAFKRVGRLAVTVRVLNDSRIFVVNKPTYNDICELYRHRRACVTCPNISVRVLCVLQLIYDSISCANPWRCVCNYIKCVHTLLELQSQSCT